jgi:hypothetical protein
MTCPNCKSTNWDHANVGLIGAVICTDCGEIYMMKDKTILTHHEDCPAIDGFGCHCDELNKLMEINND